MLPRDNPARSGSWRVCSALAPLNGAITVPPGKALFFPLINFVWISTGPADPQTAEGIREIVKPPADAVTDLTCQVDGVPVKNLGAYRTESPLFDVTLPEGDVFGAGPATYGPSMDQGYYLMLAPLSAGEHTIHFKGSMPATMSSVLDAFLGGHHLPYHCEEVRELDRKAA